MRIAYISETMMTGVGRHLTDLITAMAGNGHAVHLIHSPLRAERGLLDEIDALPNVERHLIPMRRLPHPGDIRALLRVWCCLARYGPFDVVHGHSSKGGVYARLTARLHGARCLYTPHALATLSPTVGRAAWLTYAGVEWLLAPLSDAIICCSEIERDHATQLHLAPRHLAVITHGIRPFELADSHALRCAFQLADDTVLVGFVGRLEPQKAPDILVEAALHLLRQGIKLHIAVVGEGSLQRSLHAQTEQAGLARHFSWLGNVRGRDAMASFDILAMPSRYEGFPYTLLEALHIGVPIVCTPVGGAADTVTHDVNGLIVPIGAPDRLADSLRTLVQSPALRQRMGEEARRRAAAFSVDWMVEQTERLYY